MKPSTASPWLTEKQQQKRPSLQGAIKADVAVVGGGITGIMSAYYLAKAGKKVVLLEKNQLVSGETGYTTAFITQILDTPLHEIQKTFDDKTAALAWTCGQAAIDEIERLVKEEKIECEFIRCPARMFATDEKGLKALKKEAQAAQDLEFQAQVKHDDIGIETRGYLEVLKQAKFHPTKFLFAVARLAEEAGALIFEQTSVLSYEDGDVVTVKTDQGTVTATDVVIATNIPNDSATETPMRVTCYQTYAVEADVPSGRFAEAIYWDTERPYHYFRIDRRDGHDRLILGGEDHKTGQAEAGQTEKPFEKLETFLQKLLPETKIDTRRHWSGQIIETMDGLPYIGQSALHEHHYLATGYAGNGMTFGVVAALINTDLIMKKENSWSEIFSPKRLKGGVAFLKGGLNFAKHFALDRLSHSSGAPDDLKPGAGKVMEIGGKKVAVFKTPQGKIISLSPVCTHLGCIVAWNDSAKTWDCPCHGSRFDAEGKVMNGPAVKPLKKV